MPCTPAPSGNRRAAHSFLRRYAAAHPRRLPFGYAVPIRYRAPHALSTGQREALRLLARQVMAHLELRRTRLLPDDQHQKLEGVIRPAGRTDGPAPAHSRHDIFVKQEQRLLRVPTANLLYIEAVGDYVNLRLDRERLTVYGTMKDLETKLLSVGFARIHRKHIARLDRILAIEGDAVVLESSAAAGAGWVPVRVSIGSSYKLMLRTTLPY